MESRVGGGRCRTRILQYCRYLGTFLQEPAPRFYSTRSGLVLVGEDFLCKFLPDLIKPRVPCTAELFADHSVLVDLVVERKRAGRVLHGYRLPLLLMLLHLHCCTACCNAGPYLLLALLLLLWYLPRYSTYLVLPPDLSFSIRVQQSAVLCSISALPRNDSHSNIPSEDAQTSTQHWRSDDPFLKGSKTHPK